MSTFRLGQYPAAGCRPSCSTVLQTPAPVVRSSRRAVRAFAAAPVAFREEAVQGITYTVDDDDWSREFAEYSRATQQLDELDALQAELMSNVANLDTILEAPVQHVQQNAKASVEARSAKRQASREARRAKSAQAAVPPQDLQPQLQPALAVQPEHTVQLADLTEQLQTLQQLTATLQTESSAALAPPASQPARKRGPPKKSASSSPPPDIVSVAASTSRTHKQSAAEANTSTALALPEPDISARKKHSLRASRYGSKTTSSSQNSSPLVSSTRNQVGLDGTSQFIKAASGTTVLTADQQKEVAIVVKDYLWLQRVEKQLKGILKRAPTLQEWARAAGGMDSTQFAMRVHAGQQAKSLMLKSNYRLVVSIVKKFQNRGMTLQDLITEGMQGLLRGVEKYDADKGFRFSTYAHWWIRQAVTRAVQEQSRAVRLPSHIHEQLIRILSVKSKLTKESGMPPSLEEISAETGIPADRIPEILQAAAQGTSLETSATDDDGASEMKDLLEDTRATPDEVFQEDMLRQNLEEVLNELSPREAGILRMRLGLDGVVEATLEDIGEHFQVTRERVRQIEAKALHKLQARQGRGEMALMQEWQEAPLGAENNTAGRQSRGTKKT